jgi:hypothetical protein
MIGIRPFYATGVTHHPQTVPAPNPVLVRRQRPPDAPTARPLDAPPRPMPRRLMPQPPARPAPPAPRSHRRV